jgi:soluble lytic murein transglycosylase-like protein
MEITGAGAASAPAFLPLRRTGGSDFAEALRAQIRAELSRSLAGGVAPAAASGTGQASALQQSLLSRSLPTSAYSGTWADTAREIGESYLPKDVAAVFSRQMGLESAGFDPDVIYGRRVSSAGAEGIAQLMPSSYPNVNRLDPIASLNAAAQTMQANLQTFGGDLRKALAAYNAGGGTIQRLVAQLGPDWESGLPAETRLYLKELLG